MAFDESASRFVLQNSTLSFLCSVFALFHSSFPGIEYARRFFLFCLDTRKGSEVLVAIVGGTGGSRRF
jgi:hypothetical protein